MRRYCFPSVIDEGALAARYKTVGPIPRLLKLSVEKEYKRVLAELERTVNSMPADRVRLAMQSADSGGNVKRRINYQVVDPKTLEERGSALVPEALRCFVGRRSKVNVLEQAALVERQFVITHCHTAVGKAFEELLLEYRGRVDRTVWSCSARRPQAALPLERTKLTLPHGVERQDSSSDKVMTPRFNYVSTFRNLVWTSECFVVSRRSNKPIVDFAYISSLGGGGSSSSSSSSSSSQSSSSVGVPSVFVGQVTFNPNHSSNGNKTFLLLKSTLDQAFHMDVLKATAPPTPTSCAL